MDPTILLVDDEENNRKILKAYLEALGYITLEATCGEKALELSKKKDPDLVLLDVMMPGMDGFEVCQRLKSNKKTRVIPVILITVLNDKALKIRGIDVGADDFLSKPVDQLELQARIRSLLRTKKYYEEIENLNQHLLADIKKARIIQRTLIPRGFPTIDGVSFEAYYYPAEHLGGDFYDVLQLEDGSLAFYLADVAGHGLDAAMLTILIKEEISNLLYRKGIRSPKDIIEKVAGRFQEEGFPEDIFITLFMGILDTESLSISYSAAGFVSFPLIFGNGKIEKLHCPGSLITSFPTKGYFVEKKYQLEPGQGILMYTDGIIEQKNSFGEMFGEERVYAIVKNTLNQKRNRIQDIVRGIEDFANGRDFEDDVSLLEIFINN